MKLKGLHFANVAEIQEAVTNELKKVQKRNFQQLFRNAQNAVYMSMEFILNKKGVCLLHVSSIFKTISPKTFGPHCVLNTKCVSCYSVESQLICFKVTGQTRVMLQ